MSPLFKKRAYIAAQLEATYQTEAAWTDTDFIQVTDLSIEPLSKSERLEVNQQSYSQGETIVTQLSHKATFKVPLWAQDQTASEQAVPRYFNLLKACATALTTGGVGSEYTSAAPNTPVAMAANTAVGLKIMESELLMSYMAGCYGTFKIVLEYGKIPMIEFEFYGLYEAPELYSNPVTPDPWDIEVQTVHPWRNVYCAIRFGSGSAVLDYVLHKVEIDLKTKVVERPDATAEYALAGYLIAGREPTATLSFEKRSLAAESATEFMIGNEMCEFRVLWYWFRSDQRGQDRFR